MIEYRIKCDESVLVQTNVCMYGQKDGWSGTNTRLKLCGKYLNISALMAVLLGLYT
jgi:hypothetical protein